MAGRGRRCSGALRVAVVVHELPELGVQQAAAELVAERVHMIGSIPTRRGAKWPMGKNWTNSMSISSARRAAPAHGRPRPCWRRRCCGGRGASAAGRQDDRAGRDEDGRPSATEKPTAPPAAPSCRTRSVTQRSPTRVMPLGAARGCAASWRRRGGREEIDIDAARPVRARRVRPAGCARPHGAPADPPPVELADLVRPALADEAREGGVAEARPAVSVSARW